LLLWLAVGAVVLERINWALEHWDEVVGLLWLLALLALVALLAGLWWVGSAALPLSLAGFVAWLAGRRHASPLVRSAAGAAAALGVGFGAFAALYIVLSRRTYPDAAAWAQAGELAWRVETSLLAVRHFLQRVFGGAGWLCVSISVLLVLLFVSLRFRSWGWISKFTRLQAGISFLSTALLAATTFTVLVPLGSGEVLQRRFDAIRDGIEASIRHTQEAASRALAARIAASSVTQLQEQQRSVCTQLIGQIQQLQQSPTNDPIVMKDWIKSSVQVHSEPLTLTWSVPPAPAEPESERVTAVNDVRVAYREAEALEQTAMTWEEQERKKAREAIVATLFGAATPELDTATGAFLDVLVDTIADPLAERITAALDSNLSDSPRLRRLAELLQLKTRFDPPGGIRPVVELTPPTKAAEKPQPAIELTQSHDTLDRWLTRKAPAGSEDVWDKNVRELLTEADRRGVTVEELARQRQIENRMRERIGPRPR